MTWTCHQCGAQFLWWPDNWLISQHVISHQEKEKNMDDQMEQVWRSKDGQVTGSKEEVEAYLKSKNPLAGMKFPYSLTTAGFIEDANRNIPIGAWAALVAFANLAPLIQETLAAWDSDVRGWRDRNMVVPENATAQQLLLAYEEALKQVPL